MSSTVNTFWPILKKLIVYPYPLTLEADLIEKREDGKPVPKLELGTVLVLTRPASEQAVVSELEHCPAARYLLSLPSPRSRRSSASQLRKIAHTVGAWDWHLVDWAAVGEPEFAGVLAVLQEESKTPASFNAARAAFRGVMKQGMLLKLIKRKVYIRCSELVNRRKADRQAAAGRYVPFEEQDAAIDQIHITSSEHTIRRNLAIVRMALDLGLRRSEIVGISMKDLALSPAGGSEVSIIGKGDKHRDLNLCEETDLALRDWLEQRGQRPGPLFCQIRKSGQLMISQRLSGQAVYKLITEASSTGKLSFGPHDCRRTFISDIIDSTHDLSVAQDLAGHSSIETTTLYDRRGKKVKVKAMTTMAEYRKAGRESKE